MTEHTTISRKIVEYKREGIIAQNLSPEDEAALHDAMHFLFSESSATLARYEDYVQSVNFPTQLRPILAQRVRTAIKRASAK